MAQNIGANQLKGSQVLVASTPVVSQSLGQQIISQSKIQPVQSQLYTVPLYNVSTVPLYNVSTVQPVQNQLYTVNATETVPQTINVSTVEDKIGLLRTTIEPVVKSGYQAITKYTPVVKTSYGVRTNYTPVFVPDEANAYSISTLTPMAQQSINLAQSVPLTASNISVVPQAIQTIPLTTSVQVPSLSVVPQPIV